ncbi:MAG: S8 family serine peptidase [Gemmataceae bacterium]
MNSTDVVVAVLSTGVDYTHEDLRDNMWVNPKKDSPYKHGADFVDGKIVKEEDIPKAFMPGSDPKDRHYHGTHVAGIIGAVGNNKIGVCGVCWRVKIMAVRCLNDKGVGTTGKIALGIKYAVDNGVRVICLPIGGLGQTQTLKEAIENAEKKGVLIVCPVGNVRSDEDRDNDKDPIFPGSYAKDSSNIICVGAIDKNEKLLSSSRFGAKSVHLMAPGEHVLSTYPMGREKQYNFVDGTSNAAAYVAGAAALCWAHPRHKNASAKEIKELLMKKARRLTTLKGKCVSEGTLDIGFLKDE